MNDLLLDTNVMSEWVKPQPDPNVMTWTADVDEDRAFLSVASIAELRRGVELLPPGRRRDRLESWVIDDLCDRFAGRILAIDQLVAETWGEIMARAQRVGTPMGAMDGFFAATAVAHGLVLVTRNVRHFAAIGVTTLNPWQPRSSME